MYKTVNELSANINRIIDTRWSLDSTEEDTCNILGNLFSDVHNRELAFRGDLFSATFERQLGKKRLEFLKSTLYKYDSVRYNFLRR